MPKENKIGEIAIVSSRLIDIRSIIDDCIKILNGNRKIKTDPSAKSSQKQVAHTKLNFELNERNFVKTYAKGLSGPKKFVLLISYFVKGKVGADVDLNIIKSKWSKMTAKNLLGYKFNFFFTDGAKTQGWVDSKKPRIYRLTPAWMNIFK